MRIRTDWACIQIWSVFAEPGRVHSLMQAAFIRLCLVCGFLIGCMCNELAVAVDEWRGKQFSSAWLTVRSGRICRSETVSRPPVFSCTLRCVSSSVRTQAAAESSRSCSRSWLDCTSAWRSHDGMQINLRLRFRAGKTSGADIETLLDAIVFFF